MVEGVEGAYAEVQGENGLWVSVEGLGVSFSLIRAVPKPNPPDLSLPNLKT